MEPKYRYGDQVTWLTYSPQGTTKRTVRIVAGPLHGRDESFGKQPAPPLWSYEVQVIDGDGAGSLHVVLQHDLVGGDVNVSV